MWGKLALAASAVVLATAAAGAGAQSAPAVATPPPGPGLTLITERCGFCHATTQVFTAKKPASAWPGVVQSMVDRGAELTPEEQKTVSDYLAAHYATDASAPAAAAAPSAKP